MDDDDVRILDFIPKNTIFGKRKRNNIEKAESSSNSNNTRFVCEICTDTKTMKDVFYISGCSHAYCSDCIAKYINSKLQDNIINVRCPVSGCSGLLEAEFCRSILPAELFESWCKALCEALFVSEKFYCPFRDCSALLIKEGTEAIRNSECPHCNRMFCAKCKIPWHEGIECIGFKKKMNAKEKREEEMFMQLAEKMEWRRCPNCNIHVSKSEGCDRMTCRFPFCLIFYCISVISSKRPSYFQQPTKRAITSFSFSLSSIDCRVQR